jgi:hypothetical protein
MAQSIYEKKKDFFVINSHLMNDKEKHFHSSLKSINGPIDPQQQQALADKVEFFFC